MEMEIVGSGVGFKGGGRNFGKKKGEGEWGVYGFTPEGWGGRKESYAMNGR